jgi:hypothetical protein
MQRKTIVTMAIKLSPCVIAMEACCGAHHLGRLLRLMSPEYVRPYVKAQKNGDRDAEAIAEAAPEPLPHAVPVPEFFRKSPPSDIMNHKIVQGFEKLSVVPALVAAPAPRSFPELAYI